MPKTAIIIPCFNEAQRFDQREFSVFLLRHSVVDFIFVNDGSDDSTGDILERFRNKYPQRAIVVQLGENSGKAEAVRRGFQRAFQGRYELIGYWDADLATPLEEIDRFSEIMENPGIQLIIGARVRLLGREIVRDPLRHLFGRVFATMASLILGIQVYDTQCGAKLFRNTETLRLAFSKPFWTRWIFDVEVMARLMTLYRCRGEQCLAASTVEYPLQKWTDVRGSKLKATDFLKVPFELMKIFLFIRHTAQGEKCRLFFENAELDHKRPPTK